MTRLIWTLEGVLHCQVYPCDWTIEICHFQGPKSISDSISAIGAWNVHTMLTTLYLKHCQASGVGKYIDLNRNLEVL